ncbi:hillarin-like [Argopecten irradians]|uniref:hillarin-like n=1 Tax=Argopecten irradians TaxID=31199 RepID=UPI003722D0DE
MEEDMLRVHVFNYICRSMDTPTATISGYHKLDTVDSDIDDKQQKLSLWSAVLINDIWKYIDTNRRSVFRDEKHLWKVYRPSFCTSWLVSPLCFIQTHLPQKRYWQQLSRPVSKSEWDNMVFLTPHFFHYNLQLHSHNRYEISCDEESFTVLFRYMERNHLLFEAKLLYRGNPVQISLPKNCSCTFVETRISDTSELVVRVVPPHPGEFVLAIFGLDILEDPYKCMHLCSYKIRCNKRSDDVTLFPSVSQGRYQWGPGADTLKAGLFPANCFDSSVVCEGPSLHLKFRISSDSNNVDLVSTMTGGDNFEDNLNRHVFFWVADGLAHFLVHSPGPGRYVLNICQKMRNTTVAICSYLLEFRSTASDVVLPPGFTANKLGTTKTGLAAGFEKKEWLAAFSTAPATGELVLNPVFDHDQVTNSYIQLRLLGRDCMDMTLYTKCNLEENNLSCTILLPRVGTYLLSLHVESVNGSTTCWHNAIIIAEVPCSNWAPFPSRTRDVPIDFCLHSPLSGQIPAKSQVTFSLQLNEAHDVAVVTSGGWFHLEKSISNSSLWTGNVNTGARGTDMKLCARFESGSGTFTPLCIYKVISGDEYESRSRQQSSLRETLLQRTDTNVR